MSAAVILLAILPVSAYATGGGASPERPAGGAAEAVAPAEGNGSVWLCFTNGTIHEMDDWRAEACRELAPFSGNVVDTIVVTGNTHTRREAVVREMATRPGRPLDEDRIVRDTSWLWGLGWFTEVRIRADGCGQGQGRVLVNVEERPRLFIKDPYPVVN